MASITKGALVVSLGTDLPADTKVGLTVSRSFYELGKEDGYSIDYLDDDSVISQWASPRSFDVSNAKAIAAFEKKREKLSAMGIAGKIASISPDLSVNLYIYDDQTNPAFGKNNAKLSGTCPIKQEGKTKTIEWEGKVAHPLNVLPRAPRRTAPKNMAKGVKYQLSRATPLMPHHSPKDPLAAMRKMKRIPAKEVVKVLEVRDVKRHRWLKVKASVGKGWINSTALLGQQIERVD